MYIQKDRYLDILANYKKFNEDSTKIDYSVLPQPKNNKETVNLILNQRTASLNMHQSEIQIKKKHQLFILINNSKVLKLFPISKRI